MTTNGIIRIVLFLVVVFLLVKPVGTYMAKVYEGERTFLDRVLKPFERWLYRICLIDAQADMPWQTYTIALLVFTIVGMLLLYALQRLQGVLPLNPQAMGPVDPSSSRSTPPHRSRRIRTGRTTAGRARSATSPRWRG